MVVRDTFTTVTNRHFGVTGGQRVEVVWALGTEVKAWRDALPPDTARLLPSFLPNFKCWEVQTKWQLGAQSQFGSWFTEQAVVKEVRAMLGEAAIVDHSSAGGEEILV